MIENLKILNLFAVHLKLTQYCRSTMLQDLKEERSRKPHRGWGKVRAQPGARQAQSVEGRGPAALVH